MTKNAVALTRAVAYKRNVDVKTNTVLENGAKQFNETLFQALVNDKPKLYKELKNFLKDNFKTSWWYSRGLILSDFMVLVVS